MRELRLFHEHLQNRLREARAASHKALLSASGTGDCMQAIRYAGEAAAIAQLMDEIRELDESTDDFVSKYLKEMK